MNRLGLNSVNIILATLLITVLRLEWHTLSIFTVVNLWEIDQKSKRVRQDTFGHVMSVKKVQVRQSTKFLLLKLAVFLAKVTNQILFLSVTLFD